MRVELSDGQIVRVSIAHHRGENDQPYMTTGVLTLPEGRILNSRAICMAQDQFVKKTGRRLVGNRLLAQMREMGFPQEDRRIIFRAICPEFAPKA